MAYGRDLAITLAEAVRGCTYTSEIKLQSLGVAVELPPVQLPFFTSHLRFSPLASWWIGRRSTQLQSLRLGPALLIGFPGDYAGHLSKQLQSDRPIVSTSFDGDYVGYLVSNSSFKKHSTYETRLMSFYGSDLGDYLTDVAQRCANQLADAAY